MCQGYVCICVWTGPDSVSQAFMTKAVDSGSKNKYVFYAEEKNSLPVCSIGQAIAQELHSVLSPALWKGHWGDQSMCR